MNPLMVCGTGSPSAWLIAFGILLLGALIGALLGLALRYKTIARMLGVSFLAGLILPGLLIADWFPFDGTWRHDCGYTPDPNIEVVYATLVFPIVTVVFCWLVGKWGRQP